MRRCVMFHVTHTCMCVALCSSCVGLAEQGGGGECGREAWTVTGGGA